MKCHARNENIQNYACGALENLAIDGEPAIKRISFNLTLSRASICCTDENSLLIVNRNGIGLVLKAMVLHSTCSRLQEYACGLFRNLAMIRKFFEDSFFFLSTNNHHPAGNRSKIIAGNGIELIVRAMKFHANHAGVQERATVALWSISQSGGMFATIFLSTSFTHWNTVSTRGRISNLGFVL